MLAATGLLLIAAGDVLARQARPGAEIPFWLGLALIVLPQALRLSRPAPVEECEAFGLATLTGVSLYLVKVFHSPTHFTFSDEFVHWRNVMEVLETNLLFQPNAILPATSAYPGLPAVTAALAQLGSLSPFAAGLIAIGAARLLMTWCLFVVYRELAGPRLAALAVLIYAANPNYAYFQAEFHYESLALPFAVLALALIARNRSESDGRARTFRTVAASAAVIAVTITHHLTPAALFLFLVSWIAAASLLRRRLVLRPSLAVPAFLGAAAFLLWTNFVATRTLNYLQPVFRGAMVEIASSVGSDSGQKAAGTAPARRRLFENYAGGMAPMPERALGIGSVLFTLLPLPLGIAVILRERRRDALALACAVATLAYPVTLALRLTRGGTETSNRASEFLFIAIAVVLAFALERQWIARRKPAAIVAVWLGIVAAGGLIVGWSPWARLPGPFLVSAHSRSVDRAGIATATWAREWLGPDQRLVADRIQMRLMQTYGHQHPVTYQTEHLNVAELLLLPELRERQRAMIDTGRIDYVVVDRRILAGLPYDGIYVEQAEPEMFARKLPPEPTAIDKFDAMPGAQRIYDSGATQIYDVRGLRRDQPQS